MSSKRDTSQDDMGRKLPKRILVADIAHPALGENELAILSGDGDWGNLPVTPYERADEEEAGELE